jgi:multicomponent Na+:H+ antiporter subunit E
MLGGFALPVTASQKPEQNQQQNGHATRTSRGLPAKRFAAAPFALTFVIMALFWVLFSGKFDPFHISLGFASCLIVAALNHRFLFVSDVKLKLLIHWVRFAGYIPWLFYQIFLANLHVLYLALHPRMLDLIDPKIIQFDSILEKDISRTTFANSITLTPGTITVHVSVMGKFSVHCIDDRSGESLPGAMESRIDKVFKP